MAEANKDVNGALEMNEQEMIEEGAPVQPSTDPAYNGGDDDPAGTEDGDSSDEEGDSTSLTDAEVEDIAQAAVDTDSAEAAAEELEGDADKAENTGDEDVVEEPIQETDLAAAESADADAESESDDSEYKRRLREYTRELKKQPGEWYIIQSYSGYENKVKANLETRVQNLDVGDYIFQVEVPTEEVTEIKNGQRKMVTRVRIPGYVLVRMDMNDAAWSVVRETPGVTSFVGNEGNATPVKHRDVAKFLLPKSAATGAKPEVNAEGETVVAICPLFVKRLRESGDDYIAEGGKFRNPTAADFVYVEQNA